LDNELLVILPMLGRKKLSQGDSEALGAAAVFAERFHASLSCLLLNDQAGRQVEEIRSFPVDQVFTMEDERFRSWNGDLLVASAAACVTASNARLVIFSRDIGTLELAPRLAARLSGASVVGVTDVDAGSDGAVLVETTAFGGAARAHYQVTAPGPLVVGLAPRGVAAVPFPANSGQRTTALAVPAGIVERVRIIEPANETGSRLEDARYVVSGGRGLGEAKNFDLVRELASLIGGMPGASRAIVDSGWASPAEQVGLTGSIVAPELYIAAGISGASQHMAGCSNAKVLCAINTDERAAIFTYAKFGIVDDCKAVLAELIALAGMQREER